MFGWVGYCFCFVWLELGCVGLGVGVVDGLRFGRNWADVGLDIDWVQVVLGFDFRTP